jgi:hypothetical protein
MSDMETGVIFNIMQCCCGVVFEDGEKFHNWGHVQI